MWVLVVSTTRSAYRSIASRVNAGRNAARRRSQRSPVVVVTAWSSTPLNVSRCAGLIVNASCSPTRTRSTSSGPVTRYMVCPGIFRRTRSPSDDHSSIAATGSRANASPFPRTGSPSGVGGTAVDPVAGEVGVMDGRSAGGVFDAAAKLLVYF
jgi:hypothetical protein